MLEVKLMVGPAQKPTRPDSAISEDVSLELKSEPKIGSRDIAVAVIAKLASVTGIMNKIEDALRRSAEQMAAERAAWSAPGITKVENHLSIAP